MKPRAVVFDFDGVIVDSVSIKGDAFCALYEPYGAEAMRAVRDYHEAHGGMPRYDKLRHWQRTIAAGPDDAVTIEALAARFAAEVEHRVSVAPYIGGALVALEAIHQARLPAAIASATPVDELRAIVDRRQLTRFFEVVRGYPDTKKDVIAAMIARHGTVPRDIVMIGDAASDFEAARANGCRFVGIVKPGAASPFPTGTTTLADLTHLADLLLSSDSAAINPASAA